MPSRIYVEKSFVGQGVFAGASFVADETICQISGQVVSDEAYESPSCMDLGDGTVLEPEGPCLFLNHSCSPNCELVIWVDEPAPLAMCLHATRAIPFGEELTIDYAWPANATIPCRCGSESCRGWIVAASELPAVAS